MNYEKFEDGYFFKLWNGSDYCIYTEEDSIKAALAFRALRASILVGDDSDCRTNGIYIVWNNGAPRVEVPGKVLFSDGAGRWWQIDQSFAESALTIFCVDAYACEFIKGARSAKQYRKLIDEIYASAHKYSSFDEWSLFQAFLQHVYQTSAHQDGLWFYKKIHHTKGENL